MNAREWLNVGIKLLGVYFAVLGVAVLSVTILALLTQLVLDMGSHSDSDSLYLQIGKATSLLTIMQPIAYLVGAFILTRRTEWCLGKLGFGAATSGPME